MKAIVAAVGLDPGAGNVLRRALQLARVHNATVTAVHAISDDLADYTDDAWQAFEERATEKLRILVDNIAGDERERITLRVLNGSAWRVTLAEAETRAADLLVVGTHRLTPLEDIFLGTTAERILRRCRQPVLAVTSEPLGPYRKVLVCSDSSPLSGRALGSVLRLLPGADITLLHAYETPFPAFLQVSKEERARYEQEKRALMEGQLQNELKHVATPAGGRRAPVHIEIKHGEAGSVIQDQILQLQPDLVALGAHGKSGLATAFLGSVAVTLLNHAPCDLLLTR